MQDRVHTSTRPKFPQPVRHRWADGFRVLLLIYWMTLFVVTHVPIPEIVAHEISANDKLIHATAYFILTWLLILFSGWPYRLTPPRLLLIATLVVGYAAFDEWLQTRVGRSGDVVDWLSDVIGGFCALAFACLFQSGLRK